MLRPICAEEYEVAVESSNYPSVYDHPFDIRLLHRRIGHIDIWVLPLYPTDFSTERGYRSPDRPFRRSDSGNPRRGKPRIATKINSDRQKVIR